MLFVSTTSPGEHPARPACGAGSGRRDGWQEESLRGGANRKPGALTRGRHMNKEQLVERVAAKTGATRKNAMDILNTALDMVAGSLKKGEKVTLVGFGTFLVRKRKARDGRNPQTGAKIKIPAKRVPAFTAGEERKTTV